MSKIIFTGGGSGGHVVPAITLIHKLKSRFPALEIRYIGGEKGIEKELVAQEGLPYKAISTGKLRRYLSLENIFDIFRIVFGLFQSVFYLLKEKDNKTLLFATGGFVAVPPVIAAKLVGIRVYIHEQTSRAGLANRICAKFADRVFVSFESSRVFFPNAKTIVSGLPLRDEFFNAKISPVTIEGINLTAITRPIIFITGGGNGSKLLNEWVEESLDKLEKEYFIVHQVGKQFIEKYQQRKSDFYIPLAFVGPEIIDLMKMATFIISRAGANTVCEIVSLKKKSIYVPLKIAQKNEQYYNAKTAQEELGSLIVEEDALKQESLKEILSKLNQEDYKRINPSGFNPADKIVELIREEIIS